MKHIMRIGRSLPMRNSICLAILLASVSVSGFAASPKTWSSYVDVWQNYSPIVGDPAFAEISAFTPETAITVTRIEIDARVGPIDNSTTPFSACATNHSLTLRGANRSYTLTLNTPPNVGTALHSYTDSGTLRLRVGAGTRLSLAANQGDPNCQGGGAVNIVVHYQGQDELP
jgi:hypothetical protein